ncbi:MAG: hypothetical protein WC787_02960 [Patescibacteria group bacterium]|jgi:hypothetical protein
MASVAAWFRRHVIALVFAVIVGGLCVAPHLLASRALGADYRGVPFMYLDDEDLYLGRMQEIRDGYRNVSSPSFYEYKSTHAPLLPIGETVYEFFSSLFRIGLPQMLVVTKFVFPAALFFLVYLFARRLIQDEEKELSYRDTFTAITGGLLVTLAYDLVSWRELLSWLQGNEIGLHLPVWTRPVNPITGGLLLFGWLLLVWEVLRGKKTWFVIPAGIVHGAMVGYFFSWGMAMSVLGVLIVMETLQRKWIVVKSLLLSLVIGFLVSAPYWIGLIRATGGDEGRVLSLRNGMFLTHAPILNKTLLIALILFVAFTVYHFRSKRIRDIITRPWWIMCSALLLGGLWALNQQILTGRTVWPYHFVQYTKPFVFIVLIVTMHHALSQRMRMVWNVVLGALIGFSLVQGFIPATQYRSTLEDFRRRQADADVYGWLNTEMPKDCVVFVHEPKERLERLIPAFTHCNVYMTSYVFFGVPEERLRHNLFVYLAFNDIRPEDAEEYLFAHHEIVRTFFYEDWKQLFAAEADAWSDAKAVDLAKEYAEFARHPFGAELLRYRLDVIASEDPLAPALLSSIPFELVGELGGTWIYRLKK